jgi:hypothetical protein
VYWTADEDFLAHRWAYDVTGCNNFEGLNYFGDVRMPMWWATVMVFNRSRQAELIFDTMAMIRDNWSHYKTFIKFLKTYTGMIMLSVLLYLWSTDTRSIMPAYPGVGQPYSRTSTHTD